MIAASETPVPGAKIFRVILLYQDFRARMDEGTAAHKVLEERRGVDSNPESVI